MIKKTAFLLLLLILLLSCQSPVSDDQAQKLRPRTGNLLKDDASQYEISGSAFTDHFNYFNAGRWQKADGWSNGGQFYCTWRAGQVYFQNGKMVLKLDRDHGYPPYKSGEYRTKNFYGYGLYQVRMKAPKNTGIVSSFFTYTGPSDQKPWDEIDIEFLGKNTRIVQFNYFTNGQGHHEHIHQLGFDAAHAYHTYAFKWEPGRITWYVDGRAVHSATQNIPTHPGKIMMNLWPGKGVDSWLGPYNGKTPLYAYYEWVKYTPL